MLTSAVGPSAATALNEELASPGVLGVNATSSATQRMAAGGGKAKDGDEAKGGDCDHTDTEGAPQASDSAGSERQRPSQKRRRESAAPAGGIAERALKKGRRLADGDGGLDASAPTLRPDTAAQMIEELQKKAEVMPRPVTLP